MFAKKRSVACVCFSNCLVKYSYTAPIARALLESTLSVGLPSRIFLVFSSPLPWCTGKGLAQFSKFREAKKILKIDVSLVLFDGSSRSELPEYSTGASPFPIVQDAERSEVSWTTSRICDVARLRLAYQAMSKAKFSSTANCFYNLEDYRRKYLVVPVRHYSSNSNRFFSYFLGLNATSIKWLIFPSSVILTLSFISYHITPKFSWISK